LPRADGDSSRGARTIERHKGDILNSWLTCTEDTPRQGDGQRRCLLPPESSYCGLVKVILYFFSQRAEWRRIFFDGVRAWGKPLVAVDAKTYETVYENWILGKGVGR